MSGNRVVFAVTDAQARALRGIRDRKLATINEQTMLALVTRVLLLMSLTWIMGLTKPLFTLPVLHAEISGRDLVLLIGGLFLLSSNADEVPTRTIEADVAANAAAN